MTWRKRRQLRSSLEQRVLAGERKADIVGQAAVDGQDWQRMARILALIPTPASRSRYRWLNRVLIGLLVLAEVGEVAAALASAQSYGDHSLWLVVDFLWVAAILFVVWEVARFRMYGYSGALAFALLRGVWWVLSVAMRHEVSLPLALVYAQIALLATIAVVATVTQRFLLPKTRWTDSKPKTDAAGVLVFEE